MCDSVQDPITDETRLAQLRADGMTPRGEKRVLKGDLRCRPPKYYREQLFVKTLPQFRLKDAVAAAHGEDVVMVWAHVTGREESIRTREFRFAPQTYLNDLSLLNDLRQLSNDPTELMEYIKDMYGTMRVHAGGRGRVDQVRRQHTNGLSTDAIREKLEAVDVDNRLSVSIALKALYDDGIGGPAMRWAAAQAVGNVMTQAQVGYLFQTTKEYVVQDKIHAAILWLDELKAALCNND